MTWPSQLAPALGSEAMLSSALIPSRLCSSPLSRQYTLGRLMNCLAGFVLYAGRRRMRKAPSR